MNPIVMSPIAETPTPNHRVHQLLIAFVIATIQITVIGILRNQNESLYPLATK